MLDTATSKGCLILLLKHCWVYTWPFWNAGLQEAGDNGEMAGTIMILRMSLCTILSGSKKFSLIDERHVCIG